jgi:dihydrofolate reductase
MLVFLTAPDGGADWMAAAVSSPARTRARRTRSAKGGERLHDWIVALAAWRQAHGKQGGEVNESARIVEESRENIGAGVMGRNMFGPVRGGAWGDEQWTGWWGDNPPYHYPVFIVTHHPRDPVEMEGGTTFHFVTDGIESALEQAREAAGGKDVMLGGAQVAQQPSAGRQPRKSGTQVDLAAKATHRFDRLGGDHRANRRSR